MICMYVAVLPNCMGFVTNQCVVRCAALVESRQRWLVESTLRPTSNGENIPSVDMHYCAACTAQWYCGIPYALLFVRSAMQDGVHLLCHPKFRLAT